MNMLTTQSRLENANDYIEKMIRFMSISDLDPAQLAWCKHEIEALKRTKVRCEKKLNRVEK